MIMELENRIRDDFWKAIQAHYERNDYTEAVRDAIYFASDMLRGLSGLEDKDGAKLVEGTLLGNSPIILINRFETTTEKDIQHGIGFALKGIMQFVRNPLSHEKTEYSQEQAEAIILFVDLLIKQIDHAGGNTKIQNIKELLYDKDFTDSKEYADLLLREIPKRKRYELLMELYKDRAQLRQHTLRHFVNNLIDSLTKPEKNDFIRIISSNLMLCKDNQELRMYFHYFMKATYSEVDRLAKLRVEDFVMKSIRQGSINSEYNFELQETKKTSNREGSLATWITQYVELLEKKEEIVIELFRKLNSNNQSDEDYVFKYFDEIVFNSSNMLLPWQINLIKRKLKEGNEKYYNALFDIMELEEESKWSEFFKQEYEECSQQLESNASLPF